MAATSCSDFLDEELKSSLSPENTFTSSLGFEAGSAGLYSLARSEYNTWGEKGAFMHNGACAYAVQQIATDIVFQSGAKDGSLTHYANLTMTPSTSSSNRTGTGRTRLSTRPMRFSSTPIKQQLVVPDRQGALSGRGPLLPRLWLSLAPVSLRRCSLGRDHPTAFVLNFTRTPRAELLSHMVDDLKFAVDNLP